jgi:hypothetical protein
MRLFDALTQHPDVPVFAILESDADDISEWDVNPVNAVVPPLKRNLEYGQEHVLDRPV